MLLWESELFVRMTMETCRYGDSISIREGSVADSTATFSFVTYAEAKFHTCTRYKKIVGFRQFERSMNTYTGWSHPEWIGTLKIFSISYITSLSLPMVKQCFLKHKKATYVTKLVYSYYWLLHIRKHTMLRTTKNGNGKTLLFYGSQYDLQ